jgi:hypothetical protein
VPTGLYQKEKEKEGFAGFGFEFLENKFRSNLATAAVAPCIVLVYLLICLCIYLIS